ncbi:MAG: hypothetical protein WC971_10125 [Coriobacteriia bacterium]
MNKTIAIVVADVLLAAAALGGGFFLGRGTAAAGANGGRGAFAQLSAADRQRMTTMSDAERQAFFKERGIDMPANGGFPGGGAGGAGTMGRRGGGAIEGTVISLADDSITVKLAAGGSQKLVIDDKTVRATADGVTTKLAEGASVLVVSVPEADGVAGARAIIVTK